MCSECPCLSRGLGQDDLQRSLPASATASETQTAPEIYFTYWVLTSHLVALKAKRQHASPSLADSQIVLVCQMHLMDYTLLLSPKQAKQHWYIPALIYPSITDLWTDSSRHVALPFTHLIKRGITTDNFMNKRICSYIYTGHSYAKS